MKKEELWLLKEKYNGEKSASVFNESPEEIRNKYSWGESFFADCARLSAGEPLAYVIGHVPFLHTTIYLDSRPLIPRPETEFWVEQVLTTIKSGQGPAPTESRPDRRGQTPTMKVLDLCAGSGCIGVAIGKALPEAHIDFVEIDPHHHGTIKKNIEANGVSISRTEVRGGNLFENVPGQYDYIFSNPPYIDPLVDRAEASVRAHEPHLALYGGEGGLELIARIMQGAAEHLRDAGMLIIEHEPEQTAAIQTLAARHGFTADARHDQFGLYRYTVLTRSQGESVAP